MRKLTIVFILFGLGLFIGLLFTADFNKVVQTLENLRLIHVVILIGLQFLTIALISLQWKILASHLGMPLKYGIVFEMNMVSKFYESITPALKTGGEVSKLYYLKTKGHLFKNGSTLILIQKFISMSVFALFFLSVALLSLLEGLSIHNYSQIFILFILFVSTLTLSGIGLAIYINKTKSNQDGFAKTFYVSLNHAKQYKFSFVIHVIISFAIWALYGIKTLFVIHSLGLNLSYSLATFTTLSAYLVSMVPISPGGLGTFEATFVTLLPQFGIVSSAALVIVMTLRVATFWFQLGFSALFLFIKFLLKRVGSYATQ